MLSHYGTATSVYGFTGEQRDAATGLEYLRARYYSAAHGRFTTRDTWGGDPTSPMSYNAWNYVNGNPVNATDPTGQQQCTPEGICPPPPHPTPPVPPKTPAVPPDLTVPAGVMFAMYFQDYTARLDALQQALNDPHPLSLFDLYPGDIERRDALMELWFDIHCDYDPVYDNRIEEWAAERGWDPYGLKTDIRFRWGLWKIQREPANLAGIQSLIAGAAPLGAQDQLNALTQGGMMGSVLIGGKPVYRGGPSLVARDIDVAIDKQTKLVTPKRGVSLNLDPSKMEKFGGAHMVESIPEGLKIIQRGTTDPGHYEIVPAYPMSLEDYNALLQKVVLVPYR